jgi:cell wall-associated NlpC family hydrolase
MQKFAYILLFVLIGTACGKKKAVVATNGNIELVSKYAEILQVSSTSIKNIALYQFIDDWYGTKYQYGGLTKSGIDCSGFCNVLYSQVYKKELSRTTSELSKQVKKVSKQKLEEGNLVFFNIEGKKNAHVGVYLINNKFVHASTSKGVIISSLENPYYIKAYNKGGRL